MLHVRESALTQLADRLHIEVRIILRPRCNPKLRRALSSPALILLHVNYLALTNLIPEVSG